MIFNLVGFLTILYLYSTIGITECRRSGGGSRSRGGSSSFGSRSSTGYRPSSSGSRVQKPIGWNPPPPRHNDSPKPIAPPIRNSPVANAPPHNRGVPTQKPIGWDPPPPHHFDQPKPIAPPIRNSPVANAPPHNSGVPTQKPIGWNPGVVPTQKPIGWNPPHHVDQPKPVTPKSSPPIGNSYKPSAPVQPPKHNSPVSSVPSQNAGHYGQTPPPYHTIYQPSRATATQNSMGPNTHYNPAGYGPPPSYTPANNYGHYPAGGYHPSFHPYQQPHVGGGGVTIINNNNNNYHHSGGYRDWSYSPPVYTSHDTGSTALGFFLGYSLGKVSTPSYYYHNSYYDGYGYTPRFDHYTVHHYYHNRETVPKEATIEPNTIVGCVGDSGSFCPANTTSLCTSNGAVMCVASATSTVPCTSDTQTNCVRSSIPCKDNNGPECKQTSQATTSVSIPCISTAKIYGNISYQNNSIVVSNATTDGNAGNITANYTLPGSSGNLTSPITNNATSPTHNATNTEKGPPQVFCVTVLALPAERKLTEGEKLFAHTKDIFSQFAVKVLGIN